MNLQKILIHTQSELQPLFHVRSGMVSSSSSLSKQQKQRIGSTPEAPHWSYSTEWSIWDNPFEEVSGGTTTTSQEPEISVSHPLHNPFLAESPVTPPKHHVDDDSDDSSVKTIRFADQIGQPLETICLVPNRSSAAHEYWAV